MILVMILAQHKEGSAGAQPHAFSTFASQMRPAGGDLLAATCCGKTVKQTAVWSAAFCYQMPKVGKLRVWAAPTV